MTDVQPKADEKRSRNLNVRKKILIQRENGEDKNKGKERRKAEERRG
jgi:hypothetical protein